VPSAAFSQLQHRLKKTEAAASAKLNAISQLKGLKPLQRESIPFNESE